MAGRWHLGPFQLECYRCHAGLLSGQLGPVEISTCAGDQGDEARSPWESIGLPFQWCVIVFLLCAETRADGL